MNWRVESCSNLLSTSIKNDPSLAPLRALMVSPVDAKLDFRKAAVIVSRLPLRWRSEDRWLGNTRLAVEWLRENGYSLVSSVSANNWNYVTWCSNQAKVPMMIVLPPVTAMKQEEQAFTALHDLDLNEESTIFIAPVTNIIVSKEDRLHLRDRLVAGFSEIKLPVALRKNGFWHKYLDGSSHVNSDFLTEYPKAKPSKFWKYSNLSREYISVNWSDYYVHLTRGVYGPWPGERIADYFHDLTKLKFGNPRDEFATLTYILNSGILRGSGSTIRESNPVIAFTDLAPDALLNISSYRSRLHGSDFHPYGIAIRKEVLKQLGVRPVIYDDSTAYDRISKEQRPYFQSKGDSSSSSRKGSNWLLEQELRLVGDLDLASIFENIIAIVPTREEAQSISALAKVNSIPLFESLNTSKNIG